MDQLICIVDATTLVENIQQIRRLVHQGQIRLVVPGWLVQFRGSHPKETDGPSQPFHANTRQHLQGLLNGELLVNHAILGNLQDVFNLLPNLSTPSNTPQVNGATSSTDNTELARALSINIARIGQSRTVITEEERQVRFLRPQPTESASSKSELSCKRSNNTSEGKGEH
ncbi:MAG: hypothetical protein Q9221_008033 [Calogaya cf. arnoldii]